MIGINSVTIIGNIGSISDIMTTNNGAKFVNLVIATTAKVNTNKSVAQSLFSIIRG